MSDEVMSKDVIDRSRKGTIMYIIPSTVNPILLNGFGLFLKSSIKNKTKQTNIEVMINKILFAASGERKNNIPDSIPKYFCG